jgi:ubiquinone/menaquinone biosynthesis C-methylase UbiE
MNSADTQFAYTDDYFLKQVDGFAEFADFIADPSQLFPRYRRNRELLGLEPIHTFLDIGCGRGEQVMTHSKLGGPATGIDYSGSAIQIARAKAAQLGLRCEFIEGSFESLDGSHRYDRIMASEFIEHISAKEGARFFFLALQLLNPGGRLLVYTHPNVLQRRVGYKLQRFLYQLATGKRMPAVQPDTTSEHYLLYHLNEQSFRSLRSLARGAGFRRVRLGYDTCFPPPKSHLGRLFRLFTHHTPLRHFFLTDLVCIAEK